LPIAPHGASNLETTATTLSKDWRVNSEPRLNSGHYSCGIGGVAPASLLDPTDIHAREICVSDQPVEEAAKGNSRGVYDLDWYYLQHRGLWRKSDPDGRAEYQHQTHGEADY
jgi:hypothetical protein